MLSNDLQVAVNAARWPEVEGLLASPVAWLKAAAFVAAMGAIGRAAAYLVVLLTM